MVLRLGDVGYNFYFIISGSVLVEIENINEKTGKLVKLILKAAASSFGDVAGDPSSPVAEKGHHSPPRRLKIPDSS